VSLLPVVFIPREGPMETIIRRLAGPRIFTAVLRRRQGECAPVAPTGANGADDRGGA
jgi:hypothetical protein